MKRKLLGTLLILGGMLTAAHADTWLFTDTLRPNGHERSMAAKRADFRKCGADRGGRSFNEATAPNMQQCMFARGWALDHVVRDIAHARRSPSEETSAEQSRINQQNADEIRSLVDDINRSNDETRASLDAANAASAANSSGN